MILYTDGISGPANEAGRMFFENDVVLCERLKEFLDRYRSIERSRENIYQEPIDFAGSPNLQDGIILEICGYERGELDKADPRP